METPNIRYGIFVHGHLEHLHEDFSDELPAREYARLTNSIHPTWNVEVKPINKTESKFVILDEDYRTAIHWQPSDKTANVRCLNGSAHVRQTTRKEDVTCAKCLDTNDKSQNKFWDEFFQKHSK